MARCLALFARLFYCAGEYFAARTNNSAISGCRGDHRRLRRICVRRALHGVWRDFIAPAKFVRAYKPIAAGGVRSSRGSSREQASGANDHG
ncbi:MAG: hypothetical protein WBV48_19650 [Candidatus Acidiferrales bacterium]